MCFSDTATVNKEIYLGKDMEALRNPLCPVLKLINHHVSMSKLVRWIEFFSYLLIRWALAVFILVGAKFTRIHVVMFLILSILMLQESDTCLTVGIDLIILGLLFIWSSRRKQQANNQMEGKSCSQTWNPRVALRCFHELCIRDSHAKYTSSLCL
ncbi:hypothetical protein HN51_067464 [Arachis hypogaea]